MRLQRAHRLVEGLRQEGLLILVSSSKILFHEVSFSYEIIKLKKNTAMLLNFTVRSETRGGEAISGTVPVSGRGS